MLSDYSLIAYPVLPEAERSSAPLTVQSTDNTELKPKAFSLSL